ncbi:MAG: ABC transporter ATP-binding protein [Thiolinea sp.]
MTVSRLVYSQLSKCFGKRTVLKNVDLTLTAGECILLTGKNGSGKTTLMRILAGLEKPDTCLVTFGNDEYSWRAGRNLLQKRVMYLHQQPYMFSGTVWHNLDYALPRQLNKTERQQQIQAISAWAGLGDIIDSNAKSLSGGECQRVAIARARLRRPQALLLDEPTASMDSQARDKTLELMRQLCAEGVALMVTSHDPVLFKDMVEHHLHLEQQKVATAAT